ncbi:MAG: hypothetical protein IIX01_00195 [Clostridia bacterium]|nr:hypothetical protein [Clostridia bacterium]
MKKTYVNSYLEIVELTEEVVRTSGAPIVPSVSEDEQPDYVYSDAAWGDRV